MDLNNVIIILTIIGGLVCVVKSAWGLLRYTVENIVNPLSNNIGQLQETTKEVKELVDFLRDKQQELDRRLVVVEQSVQQAHKRLDEVTKTCKHNMDMIVHTNMKVPDHMISQ